MSQATTSAGPRGDTRWHDADDLRWAARHWAARMGVRVSQIHLRQMSNKWASISMSGRLTLNTELLDLPRELGEYVIVHELAHLLVPNHGRVFKAFMDAYLPDWREKEQELRASATRPLGGPVNA
ncbi:MAG TPA: M48 family metallopeptidase [Chloroflexota bacterium]|nr:M48 family metallopeptidase [Chloroflexota bacterium]